MSINVITMRKNAYITGLIDLINANLSNKKDLIGIEIGSYAGESTELFLKSNAFKILYCIDPWQTGYDRTDLASYSNMKNVEATFDQKFKNNNIIKKIKSTSKDALNLFEDNSIDFIYIDGCHTYDSVKWDVEHYINKIKASGIISGHDYIPNNSDPNLLGVKKAIDEFFKNKLSELLFYQDSSWLYNIKN